MTPELEETLLKRYPKLFGSTQDDGTIVTQLWGFEHHDGWFGILDALCQSIQKRVDSTQQTQVRIRQVKEKFGELRFYYTHGDEFIKEAVETAEALSLQTCEECGRSGKQMNVKGWVITRCSEHTPK